MTPLRRRSLEPGRRTSSNCTVTPYMKRKLVSRNYHRNELRLLYPELRVGDLLEFKRKGFSHWAVYIGLEKYEGTEQHCVIHRSLPAEFDTNERSLLYLSSRSIRSPQSIKDGGGEIGSIQIDSIKIAFGHSDDKDVVRINNELDEKWRPFAPEEIVARAKEMMSALEQERYNLATNNCEHFATRCRYGRKFSRQIAKGVLGVATTVVGVAASFAAKNAWKAAMPVLVSAAAAAGVTVGPVAVAVIGAVPTIAGAAVSVAPTLLHAIESHRGRK